MGRGVCRFLNKVYIALYFSAGSFVQFIKVILPLAFIYHLCCFNFPRVMAATHPLCNSHYHYQNHDQTYIMMLSDPVLRGLCCHFSTFFLVSFGFVVTDML